nr:MAG TPA: hypothetical protein [Caudoviricetes sp.]
MKRIFRSTSGASGSFKSMERSETSSSTAYGRLSRRSSKTTTRTL